MTHSDGWPAEWSPRARTIASATDRGIRAAGAQDLDGFTESVEQLEKDSDTARDVHAHLIRELLEMSYQDGLSSDDVSEVLTRTVAGARFWQAPVTASAVAAVLTGALGVGLENQDSVQGPTEYEIIGAAILIAADLTTSISVEPAPHVLHAVDEIRRAQTVEMP